MIIVERVINGLAEMAKNFLFNVLALVIAVPLTILLVMWAFSSTFSSFQ